MMLDRATIRDDTIAGVTTALVTIPQSMALAMIAGLRPEVGLYAAVVMELVASLVSRLPYMNIGPVATMSTMALAIQATVAPGQTAEWPTIAALLAVLSGLMTIAAGLLNAGQFIRFVSRSVLVGLLVGAAILVAGTQVAPLLGIDSSGRATLAGMLLDTARRSTAVSVPSLLMGAGTFVAIKALSRIGPRFPSQLAALVLSGVVVWALERAGRSPGLRSFDGLTWNIPLIPVFPMLDTRGTDIFVGAAAISVVAIIQTMAIAKALALRKNHQVDPKREILALGIANCVSGVFKGMPGAGSFGRSGLYAAGGATTRLARVVAPVATLLIVLLAAPLTHYVTHPAIAAILITTAWSVVDMGELREIVKSARHEKVVLGTTLLGVFLLPLHWAVLVGLTVSIALFLRRVSKLHIVELVADPGREFHEHSIDEETGCASVCMLQIEGPLFFAHAEEIAESLRQIAARRPRVLIIRMRRTQQIDYSVLTAMAHVAEEYLSNGGNWLMCGLNPAMRILIRDSALGRIVPAERLLQTTRRVFDSAHRAIRMARALVERAGPDPRPMFRVPELETTPGAPGASTPETAVATNY